MYGTACTAVELLTAGVSSITVRQYEAVVSVECTGMQPIAEQSRGPQQFPRTQSDALDACPSKRKIDIVPPHVTTLKNRAA
jgi:hypothetical protein